jgi:hypothetical protein
VTAGQHRRHHFLQQQVLADDNSLDFLDDTSAQDSYFGELKGHGDPLRNIIFGW